MCCHIAGFSAGVAVRACAANRSPLICTSTSGFVLEVLVPLGVVLVAALGRHDEVGVLPLAEDQRVDAFLARRAADRVQEQDRGALLPVVALALRRSPRTAARVPCRTTSAGPSDRVGGRRSRNSLPYRGRWRNQLHVQRHVTEVRNGCDHCRHPGAAARQGRRARRHRAAGAGRLDGSDGYRGRGLPGAPHDGRRRVPLPRPVHHDGPHGRGGLRRRRAARHQLAPAPRLRDGDLPDRRPVHPPGHPRRRRRHPRGLDPVDDGRCSGLLHIETPPEKLVEDGGLFNGFQLWVNLPAADEVHDAGLPAGRGVGPAAARQRRRRRAAARHRR